MTNASKYGSSTIGGTGPSAKVVSSAATQAGDPSYDTAVSSEACSAKRSAAHRGGAPIHWANCCDVAGP